MTTSCEKCGNTSPHRKTRGAHPRKSVSPRAISFSKVPFSKVPPRVLLVGTPNSGKSTLFNVVTGSHQQIRNAPGTTVELAKGTWATAHGTVDIVDLPGTYSLTAISPDEFVTAQEIANISRESENSVETQATPPAPPQLVVIVCNAAAIHGSLYLARQVMDRCERVIIALTMNDIAADAGNTINPTRLAKAIGCPVVALSPRTGVGAAELADAIALSASMPPPSGVVLVPSPADAESDPSLEDQLAAADAHLTWVNDVVALIHETSAADVGSNSDPNHHTPNPHKRDRRGTSDRLDRWLLNGYVGIPVFLAVLWFISEVVTRFAVPLMDSAAALVEGPVSTGVSWALGSVSFGGFTLSGTWFESLVIDGMLAGVGVVISFAPLMALVFLLLGLLEDSGYLARVAVLADRLMRSIGLDGRVVIPLIIGFGCNLPALSATRTLPNARQRLLTGLIIPYTSCPARLTVYLLIAGVFFPNNAGLIVVTMYILSLVLVIGGTLLLRRTLFQDVTAGPLLLVLPPYLMPRFTHLFLGAWRRCWGFIRGAGTIILATLTIVWMLLSIPATSANVSGEPVSFGNVPVHSSVYGSLADDVAVLFTPAGYGDWHLASSLMTGFVAKEVAVGALAQSYAVDEPESNEASASALGSQLRATLEQTSGGNSGAAAAAFMIFMLAYTPCLATVAEQRRLFGWRWTGGALVVQLTLAWVLSVLVFQVGRLL